MNRQYLNEQSAQDTVTSNDRRRLVNVGLALLSTPTEKVPELVTEAAAEWTNSERAALLLLDPATGRLDLAGDGDETEALEAGIGIEGSAAGWIIRNNQPLVLDSATPNLDEFVEVQGTEKKQARNLAGVPLVTRSRIIGALEVINKSEGSDYSDEDIETLRFLGALAAVAIDNGRLLSQTDLISEFMHELKTPLMALTAASELLARDLRANKQIELVEMIQRETSRLSKMAQDFLELTRLESGRVQISLRPVDLAEVINDVVRLQKAQAEARGISIAVNVADNLPTMLGDYDRLRQVFLNLTSNAIKYNEEHGQVTVNVIEQGKELLVEIADTGPGIAAENLPHLFDRFYRIPDSEGFTKGTGLGLSIAARILQEHGGRVEVESELGQGSVFRCHLPLKPK